MDPLGVGVDALGHVSVTEFDGHRVQKFTNKGVFITKWGHGGNLDGLFNNPLAIAANGSGNVYVFDRDNRRIQKFSSTGAFITKWGSQGTGTGQFQPGGHAFGFGLAVDTSGDVYAVDTGTNRVQKFDGIGNFLFQWGSSGAGEGQFSAPKLKPRWNPHGWSL
jgi:DNA-binding beta-propeller fold protein YncE